MRRDRDARDDVVANVTYWTICYAAPGHSPTVRLAEDGVGEVDGWTIDPSRARRFATKAQAETVRSNFRESLAKQTWIREERVP